MYLEMGRRKGLLNGGASLSKELDVTGGYFQAQINSEGFIEVGKN